MSPNDMQDAINWTFRLLLNQEPPAKHHLVDAAAYCKNYRDFRHVFANSNEFADRFSKIGYVNNVTMPADEIRKGVKWAYHLYFLQDPTAEQISYQANRCKSVANIRELFLLSQEFKLNKGFGLPDLADIEILNRFVPFCSAPAPAGYFNDFLGAKTSLSYLPAFFQTKSGTFEGPPGSPTAGMHSSAEWIGTLRSALEAKEKFVVVELGAGWAPWLVSSAFAAKRRGITNIKLIGVEGSAEHVEFMRRHFKDNDIDPNAHQILHAVVGAKDGIARFPKLLNPSGHYGANADFAGQGSDKDPGLGAWEEIKSISIKTLLKDVDFVDLMHIDIQGAETDVVRAAVPTLNDKVRRLVIGTHSRHIEADLLEILSTAGWFLEAEKSCILTQHGDARLTLMIDGEQVWRNKKF